MSSFGKEERAGGWQRRSQILPSMPGDIQVLSALPDIDAHPNLPQVKSSLLPRDDIILCRTARSLSIAFTQGAQDHLCHLALLQKFLIHLGQRGFEQSQGARWPTGYHPAQRASLLIDQPGEIAC